MALKPELNVVYFFRVYICILYAVYLIIRYKLMHVNGQVIDGTKLIKVSLYKNNEKLVNIDS